MNKTLIATIAAAVLAASCSVTPPYPENEAYSNNREPLVHKPYIELPLGAVRAEGWLRDQLQKQADGLTGHLDEILPNLMGERNGWLGGDGDKWERGPYWIDGLLPLAYILDDDALKAKAQKWVEWALASQTEDGFFGPGEDLPNAEGLQRDRTHDWWPRMVVLKILQQYYDATADERVIPFMTNYFRYQKEQLPENPLGKWSYWAVERGGDNLMAVYWLYNLTGEKFLLELGDILTEQTADWKDRLTNGNTLSSLFSLHCVNLAQGWKTPAIQYQANGDPAYLDAVQKGYEDMMKYIGWPNGMYGGDELLHTGNPTQGSEFCSAVELMFSLERAIEIGGRTEWADWLEKVAYNALPTQATDAFDARQYYQQLNQIEVSRTARNFVTCYNGSAATFGVATGYPCCTANMHQGWPKFVRDLWMASDDNGLAALYYGPCTVTAKAGGRTVTISENGSYPFGETISIKVESVEGGSAAFPIHLRIPGWCEGARIVVKDGSCCGECEDCERSCSAEKSSWEAGSVARIEREWKEGDEIVLTFPMEVKVTRWFENSAAVERGPLVYALRMNEKWTRVEGEKAFRNRFNTWHYEVHSDSPWNYCLLSKHIREPKDNFTVVERGWDGSYPWNLENAPVEIRAKGRRMEEWQKYGGNTGPLPYSNQYQATLGPEEDIVLIPYGCTTLRVTEFPVTD